MVNFHWQRYQITKEQREWTPRRVAAAKRAVKKEAEAMPLFPELRRVRSVEDRQNQMDARAVHITVTMRNHRAECWRMARGLLRELCPADRATVLEKWNTGFMPGTPQNLIATAQMLLGESFSRRVRELRGIFPLEYEKQPHE